MFVLLELVSVPCILGHLTFKAFCIVYGVVILIAWAILGIKSRNIPLTYDLKEQIRPNLYMVLALILIVIQMAGFIILVHYDSDDAYYLGTATTSIHTNSLYAFEPDTGKAMTTIPMRYALSGFTLFYAFLSQVSSWPVAVIAHVAMPIIMVPAVYMVWFRFACAFTEDARKRGIFLFITAIIYLFGNVSTATRETFMLYRIWQGKAILPNLIIPFILVLFIHMTFKADQMKYYTLIFLSSVAAVCTTEMGAALAPATIMAGSLFLTIRQKSPKPVVYGVICSIPALLVGIGYVIGGM